MGVASTWRQPIAAFNHAAAPPAATGVIPVKDFLSALVRIGYDGPMRAEPFNKALAAMPVDRASATTAAAMKKAFALARLAQGQ